MKCSKCTYAPTFKVHYPFGKKFLRKTTIYGCGRTTVCICSFDSCVSHSGWVSQLSGCQKQTSQRFEVRITLLYTWGWTNYWKHPAWRGVQLTSFQLGGKFKRSQVHPDVYFALLLLICLCLHRPLSVPVWGGGRPPVSSRFPAEREAFA